MLTSDLLRFDMDDRRIWPRYIRRQNADYYLAIASDLIELFRAHVGKPRWMLEEALEEYESDRVGYKILRGLIKMLDSFAEYEVRDDIDYPEFRKDLFAYVQKFRPIVRNADLVHKETRDHVLAQFVEEKVALPGNLYGDLPENHILVKMNRRLEPEDLLRRYNLALAQGLLYRCTEIRMKVRDSYKTVFRYLKLAQLMHKIHREGDGYNIFVNGPFSLFGKTQKYGVNLARFLPGLLLAEKWLMRALVNTENGQRNFHLDHNCGLTSHYKQENPFDSSVEEAFFNNFCKRAPDWQIVREPEIVDLGDSVLIPDFKLRHPDGREFLLEIVGFWTPEYLEKKLDKMSRMNCENIITAVNEKLNCSRENFSGPVIFYKTRLKVKSVMEVIDSSLGR